MASGLDVLLGVVPGASAVVQDEGHEDTGDGADHQERADRLKCMVFARVGVAHDQADRDGDHDRQDAGRIMAFSAPLVEISTQQGVVGLLVSRAGCRGSP